MPGSRLRALLLAGAAVVGALGPLAGGASAQDTLRVAPGDTLPPVILEPLIVEVLRTALPVERIPFSVSVRESGALRPGLGLDESLRAVPGVHVENRYNEALGERVSIRGFGARAGFGVRGVRIGVDGVPATLPDGQTTLSHLDTSLPLRAEIVRGPASSVHGNAAGGVILLDTRLPEPGSPAADVAAGSEGLGRVGAGAGLRLGREGRLSAWLSRSEYRGFREHGRARSLHLTAGMGLPAAGGTLSGSLAAVRYDALNPGSLTAEQRREDPTQANPFNVRRATGEEATHVQAGLGWSRSAGAWGVEASAWGLVRDLDNPIPPVIIALDRAAGGARLVARRDGSGDGRTVLTAGVEAGVQADDRTNRENLDGEPGPLVLAQDERVRGLGAFVQLLHRPHPRVDVLAGLRWDRTRFDVEDRLVGPGEPDDSGGRTMDAWSPAVGVTFRAAPGLRLHANLSTAFETPTTTELANRPEGAGGLNPALDPQRTLSVEAGAVWAPSRRTEIRLAVYRARVRGLLVPFQVPDEPGRDFFRNAGRSVHRGAEVAAGLHGERAELRMAWSWTDARFRSFRVGGETLDGKRVPGVAPHRVEAEASYAVGSGGEVALVSRWRSRMPVDDANRFHSPSWWVLDVRLAPGEWTVGGASLAPWVGVANLTDESWDASVVVNAFGERFYEPGPPRALQAGVRVSR